MFHEKEVSSNYEKEVSSEGSVDIFCEIIGHKKPAIRIFETDNAFVIMDLRGYPLVLSKDHSAKNIPEILSLSGKMIEIVQKAYLSDGIRIQLNYGEAAGQEVTHPHVHIMPRLKLEQGGGKTVTISDFGERSKMARRIRSLSRELLSYTNAKK